MDLTKIETRRLVDELQRREGVHTRNVAPHAEFVVAARKEHIVSTGPAIILIVRD